MEDVPSLNLDDKQLVSRIQSKIIVSMNQPNPAILYTYSLAVSKYEDVVDANTEKVERWVMQKRYVKIEKHKDLSLVMLLCSLAGLLAK